MVAYKEIVPFETAQMNDSVIAPTMVAQYKEQLQVGGVIQRSLVEFCKFLNNGGEK